MIKIILAKTTCKSTIELGECSRSRLLVKLLRIGVMILMMHSSSKGPAKNEVGVNGYMNNYITHHYMFLREKSKNVYPKLAMNTF